MKTSDFYFDLPEELIAQHPAQRRGKSRLLVLEKDTEKLIHSRVAELHEHIPSGSLLVFNNSKVRKARIYGVSPTGGRVEFLLLETDDFITWKCLAKKARKQRKGKILTFPGNREAEIVKEEEEYRYLKFDDVLDDTYLDTHGHIPLPPYIQREDNEFDADRYQTIYAEPTGSAAAPTAGLHFTQNIFDSLSEKGIESAYVTLHVGLGTFSPIRTEHITDHTMHTETCFISESTAYAVNKAREEKRRVYAVGTTSLRTLESFADQNGQICPGTRDTRSFYLSGLPL